MMFVNILEALVACVRAIGGSKVVGPMLWPELDPLAAQRKLLDCLNEDRPQHLTPQQVVLVLKWARERGCHVGMQYLADELSYAEPMPIEPKDEADELRRKFLAAAADLSRMAERIEQIERAERQLRKVA